MTLYSSEKLLECMNGGEKVCLHAYFSKTKTSSS